jgi:hypothetical protein
VYSEVCGVFLEPKEFPCNFLWEYIKDLVYSIPIDTIEVLRERAENSAIRNNRGTLEMWKNNFFGAFIIVLTITAVTLNND